MLVLDAGPTHPRGRISANPSPVPLYFLQMEEERDKADEYLRQSVMYLQSPQKSIRDVAIRLTGKTNPSGSLAALLELNPSPSSRTQPSGCGTPTMPQDFLPPSPTLALVLYTLCSPAKGRSTCGQAGSTGAGELCHWGLVPLVLSSCHLSRQQELRQVTCGDIRRDGCERMKDLGRVSIHKRGGVGRADRD